MSRITGVIVALATTAAVLTGSTGGAAEPPPVPGAPPGPADLPREIEGGVEVTLADGDLLRVWTSEDHRTVRARSYLYGSGQARRSRIVVLTRTGDAAPTRQEVDVDHACEDTTFANVDAHTTLFGYFGDPGQVAVIARADAAAPWALTQVAPEDAPGLVVVDRRLATQFFASPGGPLVALGSRTGRRVRAQVFDPVAQAWRSLGQSGDGRYVAVPGPTSVHVISLELGVVTLPGGTTGRCDVVVPDGPQDAVQLVAASGPRRWPTVLRHVSSEGTDRLGRFPTRTRGRCAGVEQS